MKFFKITILVLSCWFLIESTITVVDGLIDENQKAVYGIVLGNKVNEDGTLSDRLKARVDKAVDLYP